MMPATAMAAEMTSSAMRVAAAKTSPAAVEAPGRVPGAAHVEAA